MQNLSVSLFFLAIVMVMDATSYSHVGACEWGLGCDCGDASALSHNQAAEATVSSSLSDRL